MTQHGVFPFLAEDFADDKQLGRSSQTTSSIPKQEASPAISMPERVEHRHAYCRKSNIMEPLIPSASMPSSRKRKSRLEDINMHDVDPLFERGTNKVEKKELMQQERLLSGRIACSDWTDLGFSGRKWHKEAVEREGRQPINLQKIAILLSSRS